MPLPLREDSPRRIGPYAIRARLGAGGMGEVYLGVRDDAPVGAVEPVAVKVIRRDMAQPLGFQARFRREIALARSVTGPCLATVVDGDADGEVPWLATEYVTGPTLSDAVRRFGALGEEEARMLGAGLAGALASVHAAGVVHRDVKPGNVMLAADGPRLIDFGIARDLDTTPLTTTSRMVGSPAFMSPEHVAGSGRVEFASDVFCLASVLCYAATGRDPFGDGHLAAVLYRVKYVETDLSEVPTALRMILADCLVANPAARLTAAGLAARLAPDAAVRWPGPVREHIAGYERELASIRELEGPLLPGYTPTEAATGSRTPDDHLPTQGPGLSLRADRELTKSSPSNRVRYVRAAVVALVLAGALTAGLLVLHDGGEDGKGGGKTGTANKPVTVLAGIDAQGGPDGSGTIPYGRDVRPTGWKPWQGKLASAPLGCAAGRDVVVCRLTDGSYEALSTASGRKMWDYSSGESGGSISEEGGQVAFLGPTGQFFMPGGSTRPVVHDDLVLFATGNRLVALDSRTGENRWDVRSGGAYALESAPVVADGLVFADIGDLPQGAPVAAFDLRSGAEKWRKPLVGEDFPKVDWGDFWPLATKDGVLYVHGEKGLRALRTKDGKELGRVAGGESSECADALVRHPFIYCSALGSSSRMGLYRLRSPSLHLADEIPVPLPLSEEATLVAVDDTVMAIVRDSGWDDRIKPEIILIRHDSGQLLGRYSTSKKATGGRSNPASSPLIVDDTLIWADTNTLFTVALHGNDKPGPLSRTALEGAPGPTIENPSDVSRDGIDLNRELLPPEILPVGGAVYVLYDQGTVLSVPLPGGPTS